MPVANGVSCMESAEVPLEVLTVGEGPVRDSLIMAPSSARTHHLAMWP